jgi:hypothetical protein
MHFYSMRATYPSHLIILTRDIPHAIHNAKNQILSNAA